MWKKCLKCGTLLVRLLLLVLLVTDGHQLEIESTSSDFAENTQEWISETLLDVGHYLRRFKFNGFDPRWQKSKDETRTSLYMHFPEPPLRNIHWKVKKSCESSLTECLKYLEQEIINFSPLPRHLDSLTITNKNSWSFIKDLDSIKKADEECLKLFQKEEITNGNVERFRRSISASYYMCWYSMSENPLLSHFGEDCDNFGKCIDWDFGPNNRDFRANDSLPFSCALYSFCPDPCCPKKHSGSSDECLDFNPCRPKTSTCRLPSHKNGRFESLISNKWNASCDCDQNGFQWESRSGMCVDVDECLQENYCNFPLQSCVNLPGSYDCVCNAMGENGVCIRDSLAFPIDEPEISRKESKSVWSFFAHFVSRWKRKG